MSQPPKTTVTDGRVPDARRSGTPWPDELQGTPAKKDYLKAFETQFVNIVMIATFAGGVQASVLAFMNDLLSKDSIQAELFRQNPTDLYRPRYTVYSLGLMFGLFAVAGNIGVAVTAAANAALACQFSISIPEFRPFMEGRALFCFLAMFGGFICSGLSLIFLSVEFDPAFTGFVALILLVGIVTATYQSVHRYAKHWVTELGKQQLHLYSLLVSTVAFTAAMLRPVESAWYGGSSFSFAVTYHIIAVAYGEPTKDKSTASQSTAGQSTAGQPTTGQRLPKSLAASCATILAFVWAPSGNLTLS